MLAADALTDKACAHYSFEKHLIVFWKCASSVPLYASSSPSYTLSEDYLRVHAAAKITEQGCVKRRQPAG